MKRSSTGIAGNRQILQRRRGVVLAVFLAMGFPGAARRSGSTGAADAHPPRVETFELDSAIFRNRRTVRVLLPRGYDDPANRSRRYPVQYLNDGFAVFKAGSWNAPEIVARLESAGRLRPILLVGIDNGASIENGSPEQRTREYLPYPDPKYEPSVPSPNGAAYPDFLANEVMPAVARRYRVQAGPENTGLGGASYGGLAALYTAMHRPGLASRLLIESTPLFLADFAALADARAASNWPARVSIGIGTKETDDEHLAASAVPNMQALRSIILEHAPGAAVRLLVQPGATHGSEAWRHRLPAALEFLWPARKEDARGGWPQ